RQIAAAIPANHLGSARRPLERLLEIRRQNLGRQPALREDDRLQPALEELTGDATRFGEIRTPDAELGVDDRGIDEQEVLLAARRAALLDERERLADEPLGQLAGDRKSVV